MEFFNKAKAVRLRSHLGKYLTANDDEHTVWQSRNGASWEARWTVEFVSGDSHLIRLKSLYNKYLTASNEPFLLGWTGKKILQTTPTSERDFCIEWEPITDGFHVKLQTRYGKFLRANGGTPPWRNSVTHDVPNTTATQDWVLWDVDVVEILLDFHSLLDCDTTTNASSHRSFSSNSNSCSQVFTDSENGSPARSLVKRESAMEIFQKARAVRFKSHHDKYLLADEDEEHVCQDRNGACQNAKWKVEIVPNVNVVRLKSCYGKYLTASNMPFLLGVTGQKVLQTLPRRLDSSLEWEPIREGVHVKLKTRYGHYLRANGGVPPWRNSVTHDIPHRTATQEWVIWDVDVLEIQKPATILRSPTPPPQATRPVKILEKNAPSETISPTAYWLKSPTIETINLFATSPLKAEGRHIIYDLTDENGNVDESKRELHFTFKGIGLEELKQSIKEETGLDDIVVCSRNPLNGKLYPLKLHLPPNNVTMHVVVVPSTAEVAKDLK
ncbi:uncharacterized protein LOC116112890 [Pistacia vera]|uniref:uncharacterized protein LOC116112890 n=1 Tax=Pistacia vera TaxID=55513 RepID=UPI00126363B1|nr:uncharacterized protein LOC116112890 [Pistacia vera]